LKEGVKNVHVVRNRHVCVVKHVGNAEVKWEEIVHVEQVLRWEEVAREVSLVVKLVVKLVVNHAVRLGANHVVESKIIYNIV
jgi:hypothetical protein